MRQQIMSQEAQYVTRRSRGVAALLMELPDYPRTTALLDHLEGWAYRADPEERDEGFEQTFGRCRERGEYVAWMLEADKAEDLMRVLRQRRPSSTTTPPEVAWHF